MSIRTETHDTRLDLPQAIIERRRSCRSGTRWPAASASHSLLTGMAAVLAGLGVALLLGVLASSLPAGQGLNALAALAAGAAVVAAALSLNDPMTPRAVLRVLLALVSGVLAYQALPLSWPLLGLAWTVLLGWLATEVTHCGSTVARLSALSMFATLALFSYAQI